MSERGILVCLAVMIGGCAISATVPSARIDSEYRIQGLPEQYEPPCSTPEETEPMQPVDVAIRVARAPDHCQPGTFVLTVRRIDHAERRLFLDSQSDYRRPDNLAISVSTAAMDALTAALGESPQTYLWDRKIIVTGVARRIKIRVYGVACPGCFYYQTQVPVTDAAQIQVAGGMLESVPRSIESSTSH